VRASARTALPGRVSDAEALWYDERRWPAFVDGFGHVTRREGEWPQPGAVVLWASTPGGRGLVREQVVEYAVRRGCTTAVEDESITGTQTVAFAPGAMTLELDFTLKQRNVLTALFVRRAFGDSLRRTLARFARELRGDLELTR
jgi:hypothetical protein